MGTDRLTALLPCSSVVSAFSDGVTLHEDLLPVVSKGWFILSPYAFLLVFLSLGVFVLSFFYSCILSCLLSSSVIVVIIVIVFVHTLDTVAVVGAET
jgi:hypothetical protein